MLWALTAAEEGVHRVSALHVQPCKPWQMWLISVAGCFHPSSGNKEKCECKMHFGVWNSHCKLHRAEEGCTGQDRPKLGSGALGRIHKETKLALWLQEQRSVNNKHQNNKWPSALRCREYFSPASSPNLSFGCLNSAFTERFSAHGHQSLYSGPFLLTCWCLAVFDSETSRSAITPIPAPFTKDLSNLLPFRKHLRMTWPGLWAETFPFGLLLPRHCYLQGQLLDCSTASKTWGCDISILKQISKMDSTG